MQEREFPFGGKNGVRQVRVQTGSSRAAGQAFPISIILRFSGG